jgi:hypothetical protein
MTTSDAEDWKVRELLDVLEQDRSQISGRRDEILRDVLAHYEQSRQQTDVDVLAFHPSPERPRPRNTLMLCVASVALLTLVAGLMLLVGGREGTTPADTTPAGVEPTDLLVLAGGNVSIEVPDGLSVVQRRDGLVLLGRDGAGTGIGDAIVIVEDAPRDFGSEMAQLSAEGVILSSLSGSNVDGRRLDRWTVAITQDGLVATDCSTDEDCLELVPGIPATALTPGLKVGIVELVTSDGQTVLVMTDEDGPLRTSLASLLSTLKFE